MKYLTKKELRKVAEILNIYITQNENGDVYLWETKPYIREIGGEWVSSTDTPINSKLTIAPYTRNWKKSLITPMTNSYMEAT